MTKRDDILERNRWASHYAVLAGKEPLHVKPVPDLKPRKERAPSMEPTEHASQVVVVKWWDAACKGYGLPRFALYAVPNAQMLYRLASNPNAYMSYMKAEGLRKGVPDLQLDVPRNEFHGLRLEMKGKNGIVSPEQHEIHNYLRNAGYWVEVPRSAEMAIQCVKTYLGGN